MYDILELDSEVVHPVLNLFEGYNKKISLLVENRGLKENVQTIVLNVRVGSKRLTKVWHANRWEELVETLTNCKKRQV